MKPSKENKEKLSIKLQDINYMFPYHYLVDFNTGTYSDFCQFKNSPGGYRYASYLIGILKILKKEVFNSIVDIGCGDGFFIRKLKEQFPRKKILGIDSSKQAISLAKILNQDKYLQFLNIDIIKNEIPNKFDIVTLIEVLEHIPINKVDPFLESISKLLKKDGKLILTVPSKNLPIRNIKRHFQHFNAEHLTKILSEYFEVIHLDHINKKGFLSIIIDNMFTNKLFILNNKKAINSLFQFYMGHCYKAKKEDGLRLLVICRNK